jgi:hypothetical protein
MHNKLALIREAIALAQKQVASLKEAYPNSAHELTALDELEMGLEWSMKRAERLPVLFEVVRADKTPK